MLGEGRGLDGGGGEDSDLEMSGKRHLLLLGIERERNYTQR